MKHLYILAFSLLFSFGSLAQTDLEDVYGTWYIWGLAQDLDSNINVDDVSPSIAPTITINEDLSFSGICACNTFSGQFVDLGFGEFEIIDYERTEGPCSSESQDDFEHLFFQYLPQDGFSQFYWFEYYDGGLPMGNELYINENPGFAFLCQSEPLLSTPDKKPNQISVYPNPVLDRLIIDIPLASKITTTVTSITGKIQNVASLADGQIDVSHLASGLYILTVESEEGIDQIKFIKQ